MVISSPRLLLRRLALALLITALLPATLARAANTGCLDRYYVRSGDSLTGIANRYGFDWQVLADLNKLKPPYDLLAGQWLCLPAKVGAEASAGVLPPERQPRLVVQVRGRLVEVQVFNFPVKRSYTVKIADNRVPFGYIWFTLGRLNTKKTGDLTRRYDLPAGLKDTPSLLICLKERTTDEMKCQATRK